jgi:hypothetical protein
LEQQNSVSTYEGSEEKGVRKGAVTRARKPVGGMEKVMMRLELGKSREQFPALQAPGPE